MTPHPARPTVVLLHGHDSRPEVWSEFADALTQRVPGVEVEALAGTVLLGSDALAAGGPVFRAWFDEGHDLFPSASEAVEWVRSNLTGPSVLVGFSQGGAVALGCAFDSAGPGTVSAVVAVVAIGAFLPDDVTPRPFGGELVVLHGEEDLVVDVMFAERLARQATAAGVPTTLQLHPGGHEISPDALDAVVDLLGRLTST